MSEEQKRATLLESVNHISTFPLSREQKELFNWFLYEQPSLEHVSIHDNLFYYALGRVLEINISYDEDKFGHAENIQTSIRYVNRNENGEYIIESLPHIFKELKTTPPLSRNTEMTIVFNYINESVEDDLEILSKNDWLKEDMQEAFIAEIGADVLFEQGADVLFEQSSNASPFNWTDEPPLYPEEPVYSQQQRAYKKKGLMRDEVSADMFVVTPAFFESLEEINMKRLWENEINKALDSRDFARCKALQIAMNESKNRTINVQKQTFANVANS